MGRIVVVAVGGNALTLQGQAGTTAQIEANAVVVADGIDRLCSAGWRVVVVHGNGPQVGNLAVQQEGGLDEVPAQPLHTLGAMSQGQLGSALVRAIDDRRGPGAAVAIVSHITVDPEDAAFQRPTKPIGPFFDRDRALALAAARGWTMAEDSGRGYRRVVASPRPLRILEASSIKALVRAGKVVLAGGGGGVPVEAGRLAGMDAVIDKDRAAARIAADVHAGALLLVTATDAVMLDFGTPRARPLATITVEEAQSHLDDGQFPPGSMGPKIEAAVEFVRGGGEIAAVTSAPHLVRALEDGGTGTRIVTARNSVLV